MRNIDINCPECTNIIGTLIAEDYKRIIVLNLDIINEFNHVFECPYCIEQYVVELVFTKQVYTERVSRKLIE